MELLTDEEVRVLGCLAEKEATVPDVYPLTRNALRSACNQSTARDPVVSFDELTVQRALDSLKAAGLVRFVHPAHGERSTKYRHVLDERLGLDRPGVAVLALLFLRGPQTAAEVRTRAERLHAFAGTEDVERTLAALAAREEPLVVALPRGRWAHLLAGPVDASTHPSGPRAAPTAVRSDGRLEQLEAEVASLRSRLERLEGELGLSAE